MWHQQPRPAYTGSADAPPLALGTLTGLTDDSYEEAMMGDGCAANYNRHRTVSLGQVSST